MPLPNAQCILVGNYGWVNDSGIQAGQGESQAWRHGAELP